MNNIKHFGIFFCMWMAVFVVINHYDWLPTAVVMLAGHWTALAGFFLADTFAPKNQ